MIEQQLARVRTHRSNIQRYRNLLQTSLTELERQFIEKRLAEEQSNLESLATSCPQGTSRDKGSASTCGIASARHTPHVNFEALATLRKWPSRNNERIDAAPGPYLIAEHTLDECIRQFMAKPASARHLYEIHTTPQPLLVGAVLSQEIVAELARLRDFLGPSQPEPRARGG